MRTEREHQLEEGNFQGKVEGKVRGGSNRAAPAGPGGRGDWVSACDGECVDKKKKLHMLKLQSVFQESEVSGKGGDTSGVQSRLY